MTSLIHPIHSISQKCRPKHQVLVLKCYPKYQKNVQEAKPSSSELSYLLYYASSRRSKLQKVGAFLEKKVGTDVWMGRLSNVQVSLHIVTALIEKTPRDLMLYSGSVLNILDSVLRSRDINMVEESLPTFEVFCRNIDAANVGADKQRAKRYLILLKLYAGFVDKNPQEKHRVGESVAVAVRWRTAGLRGIKAAVSSNALTVDADQQLNLVMPIILDNMALEQGYLLAAMQRRAKASERQDEELAKRRRMSTATVATIFSVGNASARGHTRLATAHVLKFIAAKNPPWTPVDATPTAHWATSLFEAITRWTPVHDRYLIVLTAVESLVRSPVIEPMLEKQLVLATLVDWLLSSDINLIGLSVMDVLIGFIHHTLLLLQLGGKESARQSDILGLYREAKETFDPASVLGQPDRVRSLDAKETIASPVRQALLQRLQNCVAALSNHIYYTDQIADMITAILARLKPTTTTSDILTTAQAINNPAATTKAIAEAASLHDDPTTDSFFSFATARSTALKTVKGILVRANSGRTAGGVTTTETRSRVGVHAWDGTQWLLKDSDSEVRLAYVDALLTWLRLETNQTDLLIPQAGASLRKSRPSKKSPPGQDAKAAQSSSFLQLLHLAIYDAVLDSAGSESDVLLLYLLLSALVERLGVNALRSGLPMVFKLQDDALSTSTRVNPTGKVRIAGLVHGYFWTIADKFGFVTTETGKEILGEISRRKQLMIWFDKIKVPASSVERIRSTAEPLDKSAIYAVDAIDALRPFLDLYDLVDEVAAAYDKELQAPATAAPSSPGRVFSVPTTGLALASAPTPGSQPDPQDQLPKNVKDEMTSTWSRDACIASAEEESTPSRDATVKVTELKRALSGFVGAGITGAAWRSKPLLDPGVQTPGAEMNRPPASPLRTDDVSSESRTGSSLHLPGTYPRDGLVENASAGGASPYLVPENLSHASPYLVPENLDHATWGGTQWENGITDADAAKPVVAQQYHPAAAPAVVNPARGVADALAVSESGSKPTVSNGGSVAKPATTAGGMAAGEVRSGARGSPAHGGTEKIDVESLLAGIRPRASVPWALPAGALGGGVPGSVKVGVAAPPY
ncbi:hypothetical protein DV737_g2505, partial [Chaetothyriales sp. CBS 132003]